MRPITVTVGALASAVTNSIATTQKPIAAGNLTLNGALVVGGVAKIAKAARITISSDADDSGVTFAVTGYGPSGDPQSETITGPNNTAVTSVLTYSQVTIIAISAAATGNITAGNSQSGSSQWIYIDPWVSPGELTVQTTAVGTVNYNIQYTLDDPNSPTNPVTPVSVTWTDSGQGAKTSSNTFQITFPVSYVRCYQNSGSGTTATTVLQSGSVTL